MLIRLTRSPALVFTLGAGVALAFGADARDLNNGAAALPVLTSVTERAVEAPLAPTQRRAGAISVDLEVLSALASRETTGAAIDLFDDASFTIRPNRIEHRSETSFSIGAAVDDIPGGTMVLVREGDHVLGNIWAGAAGSYEIRSTPDGLIVHELNMAAFPGCDTPDEPAGAPEQAGAPTEGIVCVDDGSEIKMLIAFTPASVAALGGADQMLGFAQLAISTTNQAYFNSGVDTSVALATFTQVNYTESGNGFTDRDRLTNPNDGFMDDIHDLRDQVDADVVSLIVNNINACGVANFSVTFGNIGNPALAFNVTRRDCAIGNLTFPHELGHNQGSRHDIAADSNPGAFNFSHGFIPPNAAFRTVMATSNLSAPRIPFFSNPDVSFGGQPTGETSSAHNALSINNTAIVVANFRTEECIAPGDLNMDGVIDGTDIAILLSVWNSSGSGTASDINGDGVVNGADLAFLLSNWTGS